MIQEIEGRKAIVKRKIIAWSGIGLGIILLMLGGMGYFVQLVVNGWFSGARPWAEAWRGWVGSICCCAALFGVDVIVCALFALIFGKTTQVHCGMSTFFAAIALSAVGALGLISGIAVASLSPVRNPVAFPAYFSVAMTSFGVFLGLIVLYCWLRSSQWSFKGIVLDIVVSVLYLPGFWMAFACFFAGLNG